jgi:hypothetical protein
MGVIIATGVHRIGHRANFKEHIVFESKKCQMICECGWNAEITSFGNPWCTIETQVRYNDHLIDCGLQPLTARHSHANSEE